ncbi:hypothetical protein GCM10023335_83010 [Streptomyces siamensis]|uniref:non-specific serine/threonine protein kinase n=1 Tax=Streptomyces siamensis TaxID=1274986 RepID=A0ABP9JPR2_9ACTN
MGRLIAGRYLLVDQVGSGGMGHVWLAHDQRLDCDVALKEIRFRNVPEGSEEHEARIARARAEARHAAVLRGHPHVVTVHDVLEHEGLPWIVMEYVAGAEDLRGLSARRGPLAPDACARVGLAVLDALTAGHERGIMHRDVKPANILLAPDRTGAPGTRILLTDYGISVQPDSLETRWTRTSVLVGTAGYLAPERATGGPPTAAADLFSLGCTLYFGVEGHGPFDRDTDLAAITAVVLEEPPVPRRAGALWPVIEALLVKDPARRISAEDTAAALARIITPQPHPPARLDTGSQPPWAGPGGAVRGPESGAPTGDRGFALPSAYPQTAAGPGPDRGPAAPSGYAPTSPAPQAYSPTAHEPPAPHEPVLHPPTAQAQGPYAPTAPAPGPYSPTAQAPGPYVSSARASGPYPPTASPPGTYDPRSPREFPSRSPGPTGPGQDFGPPGSGGPAQPTASPPPHRRRRPRVLQALTAALLALGLTAGGVWYAMAHKVVRPYGTRVGLAEPLELRDCVVAARSGGQVTGASRLEVDPGCGQGTDGQVLALYRAPSLAAARSDGPRHCAEATDATAAGLARNVASVPVIPTSEGFARTGGRVACLLVGKYGPVGGPLGAYRPYGSAINDAGQFQTGDCLGRITGDARTSTHFELVACDKKHQEKVVGMTHLDGPVAAKRLDAAADARCEEDAAAGLFGDGTGREVNHGLHNERPWPNGRFLVVCTVAGRFDGTR